MVLRIVLFEVRENLVEIQQMIFVICWDFCVKPSSKFIVGCKALNLLDELRTSLNFLNLAFWASCFNFNDVRLMP